MATPALSNIPVIFSLRSNFELSSFLELASNFACWSTWHKHLLFIPTHNEMNHDPFSSMLFTFTICIPQIWIQFPRCSQWIISLMNDIRGKSMEVPHWVQFIQQVQFIGRWLRRGRGHRPRARDVSSSVTRSRDWIFAMADYGEDMASRGPEGVDTVSIAVGLMCQRGKWAVVTHSPLTATPIESQ